MRGDDQPKLDRPDDGSRLISAAPIVPARDIEATAAWYRDRLGFAVYHTEPEYGVVGRDESTCTSGGPAASLLTTA